MRNDLKPENDLDPSKAKPHLSATLNQSGTPPPPELADETTPQKVVKIVVIAVPSALLCCALLSLFAWWQQTREAEREAQKAQRISQWIPDLVPAPSAADQSKMIAAMKAHPNPPFNADLLPPLGANASEMGTLFAAMNARKYGSNISYDFDLAPGEPGGVTSVTIEVGGNPPRIIHRLFASVNPD